MDLTMMLAGVIHFLFIILLIHGELRWIINIFHRIKQTRVIWSIEVLSKRNAYIIIVKL